MIHLILSQKVYNCLEFMVLLILGSHDRVGIIEHLKRFAHSNNENGVLLNTYYSPYSISVCDYFVVKEILFTAKYRSI